MIGKGNPGNMPFFSNAKKVINRARQNANYRCYCRQDALRKTKNHNTRHHGVKYQIAQAHLNVLKCETQTLKYIKT